VILQRLLARYFDWDEDSQNLRNKTGNKQPFTIYKIDEARDGMPRAHTCFNRIDFVEYSSRKKLAEMLWLALVVAMNAGDA
jgi:hypothetical protein